MRNGQLIWICALVQENAFFIIDFILITIKLTLVLSRIKPVALEWILIRTTDDILLDNDLIHPWVQLNAHVVHCITPIHGEVERRKPLDDATVDLKNKIPFEYIRTRI